MTKNRITLLVTGLELFHPKVRSIDAVIKELIQESRKELHIATYLLTIGASHIIEELEKAAKRGVKVIFLIDRLESKNPVIKKKLGMLDEYPNVDIISFSDPKGGHLHAKVLVMDRVKAVIGSANLSWGGMVVNYEIGVLLEGEIAWKIAEVIDRLAIIAKKHKNHTTNRHT